MKDADKKPLDSTTPYFMGRGGRTTVIREGSMTLHAPTRSGQVALVSPWVVLSPRPDDESGEQREAVLSFSAGNHAFRVMLNAEAARDLSKWLGEIAESLGPVKEAPLIQRA